MNLTQVAGPRLDARILARSLHPYFAAAGNASERPHVDDTTLKSDAVVVHLSEDPLGRLLDAGRGPGRLALVDHGVGFVDSALLFDANRAGSAAASLAQLPALSERASTVITFSPERAEQFRSDGFVDVVCLEAVIDVESLVVAESHPPTENHFDNALDGPVIFSHGNISPASRMDFLVNAYDILTSIIDPNVHLAISGPHIDQRYSFCLVNFVNELNLNKSWLTGPLRSKQLATYFRRSDIYCTVDLTGNAVQGVARAMAFGKPVVGLDTPEMRHFCGSSALLLPVDSSAELLAEALHTVIDDAALQRRLSIAGIERMARYDQVLASAAVAEHILSRLAP